MFLPETATGPSGRHALYRNLARECEASRADRSARYTRLRTAYLTGTAEINAQPLYNGLKSYVRDATSQVYAPGAVRFGVIYPPHYGDEWHDELAALTVEAHRLWHDTRMTLTYGLGVRWARVLGAAVFKNITSDRDPALELLPDPSDFGVWNELTPLAEQEAVCHFYDLPISRFRRIWGKELADRAAETARPPKASAQGLPPAMSQIIYSSNGSQASGALRRLPDMPWTTGQALEPCTSIAELWVFDDELQCFRMVPIAMDLSEEPVLAETPMGDQYDGAHAFHVLTLEDVPGYLWGLSQMDDQIALNDLEMKRWGNLDLFMQLQLDPPYFTRGLQGRDGEKMTRARAPGGEVSSNDPTAEVKSLAPPATLAADTLGYIDAIRRLKDRLSALPASTRGEAQPGVRGGDQEAVLIGEASIQAVWEAALIEASAGDIMTQLLRMQRRRSGLTLYKKNGEKFLPAQIPGDFVARVAAHSASPLYQSSVRQVAQLLKREGAIGLERYVELMDPPNADLIVPEARKREQAQAEAGQEKAKTMDEVAKARVAKDLARAKKDATTE